VFRAAEKNFVDWFSGFEATASMLEESNIEIGHTAPFFIHLLLVDPAAISELRSTGLL